MIIPWDDINVPKRSIPVNQSVITKFPVFSKLLFNYSNELKNEKYNIFLLNNLLENGFKDSSEVEYYFDTGGDYNHQYIKFSVMIFSNNLIGKVNVDIFKSKTVEISEDYNEELFEFFKRLNSKINKLYDFPNEEIYEIVIGSPIRQFVKDLPNEVKWYTDTDNTYRFVPKIEFITKSKFGIDYGIYLFDVFDYWKNDILNKIDEKLEDNEKKKILKQKTKNIFGKVRDDIKYLISKVDNKYIINIEEI